MRGPIVDSFILTGHVAHILETVIYLAQAMTYGAAIYACRKHGHPTYHTYLFSCAIHVAMSTVMLISNT